VCSRVVEEVGIDCLQGSMSRPKHGEAKESTHHRDSRESSNRLKVLPHSLKIKELV
jgi:hypothetical protein